MAHPAVFYKYTSASTALKVLKSGRLRWSSPQILNDVSEFQRMPRFDPSLADAMARASRLLAEWASGHAKIDESRLCRAARETLRTLRKAGASGADSAAIAGALDIGEVGSPDEFVEETLRRIFSGVTMKAARILCVTTAYNNEMMWANYAENNSGCVLALQHIPDWSTPLLEARRVQYSESQPIVGSGIDLLLFGTSEELKRRTVDAVCFTKKAEWSHEGEWRAMTWRPEEGEALFGDYKFYEQELESVTLGPRSTSGTEDRIRKILRDRYPHAGLFRLEADHGRTCRVPVGSA